MARSRATARKRKTWMARALLALGALIAGGVLAIRQPWNDSDYPLCWYGLLGALMFAFLATWLPLARDITLGRIG